MLQAVAIHDFKWTTHSFDNLEILGILGNAEFYKPGN